MKKKDDLIDRFVALRISGKTFEEIAKELDVSKQTLITWSKGEEVKSTITFGKLMRLQSTLKAFELDREARVQKLAILAQKINSELEKRDFSDIPTDKLLKMATINEKRLSEVIPEITFKNEETFIDFLDRTYFTFNPVD